MLIHTNQPLIKALITSFYIKMVPIFCQISDESELIRNFLRNGRVRIGLKRICFKNIDASRRISDRTELNSIFSNYCKNLVIIKVYGK